MDAAPTADAQLGSGGSITNAQAPPTFPSTTNLRASYLKLMDVGVALLFTASHRFSRPLPVDFTLNGHRHHCGGGGCHMLNESLTETRLPCVCASSTA